jgi:hypothetical protein
MTAPTRPWEPEALELPLEQPRRIQLPNWQRDEDEPTWTVDQRTGREVPGSHVIVIDIA